MSDRPVAFITGAAHGQGRATSLALAADGYDIVALDVAAALAYPGYEMGTAQELESLRAECEAGGAACLPAVADVRDADAVAQAVGAAIDRFGRTLATDPHAVEPELRARLEQQFEPAEIVLLTAFGAIMVATNVVNDALGVPLDGYLEPYRGAAA